MLTLALYGHNVLIPVLARQGTTKYYGRHLGLAYGLTTLTFTGVGLMFLTSFPLAKNCIADNLLRNFDEQNRWAFVSRALLFLQLSAVFPLVMYVVRTMVMTALFKEKYPGWIHVFVLNFFVMITCLLVCIFYPEIGTIFRQEEINYNDQIVIVFV